MWHVYLLADVHGLQVVDVATLDPLGCLRGALQHCPLLVSKATKVSDAPTFIVWGLACILPVVQSEPLQWEHQELVDWSLTSCRWSEQSPLATAREKRKVHCDDQRNGKEKAKQHWHRLTSHDNSFKAGMTTNKQELFGGGQTRAGRRSCVSSWMSCLQKDSQPGAADLPRWREESLHHGKTCRSAGKEKREKQEG